jgi:dGTP triphosphohydrolase
MATMEWDRLLGRKRLRRKPAKPSGLAIGPFEEDQDRICFSQPFRRLQAKTQVTPWGVDAERNVKRKFGFFQSEKDYAEDVANELDLLPVRGGGWCRHPLAYLVEAADDICYAIIDLEDGIDMGSFSFKEFEDLMSPMLHVRMGLCDFVTSMTDRFAVGCYRHRSAA